MDITTLVIVVIAIALFYGTLKRIIVIGEQMSLRGLNKLNDEQKVATANWYSKNAIAEDTLSEAVESKKNFDSIKF